jgi:hypothetical protein
VDGKPDLFAAAGRRGAPAPGLAAALAAFVGDARAAEAAGSRSREAFLRRSAAEEGSFAGILVDLAERATPVLVTGAAGRRQRGVLTAVGSDFAVLRTAEDRDVLLAHRGMASVTPEAGAAEVAGDRAVALPIGMVEALAVLAEERPRVLLVTVAGSGERSEGGVAGELRAVGRDVVTIRLEGPDRRTSYVPVANLAEVRLS